MASALFVGARHCLALRLEGDNVQEYADWLIEILGGADLSISRSFVADIDLKRSSTPDGPMLMVEALTIEEPET